jgi:hypothetical protein
MPGVLDPGSCAKAIVDQTKEKPTAIMNEKNFFIVRFPPVEPLQKSVQKNSGNFGCRFNRLSTGGAFLRLRVIGRSLMKDGLKKS